LILLWRLSRASSLHRRQYLATARPWRCTSAAVRRSKGAHNVIVGVFVLHPDAACTEGGVRDRPEFRRRARLERFWFCLRGFLGRGRAARLGLGLILWNAEQRDEEEESEGCGNRDYEIGIPSSHRQLGILREYLPIGNRFCQVLGSDSCRPPTVPVTVRATASWISLDRPTNGEDAALAFRFI